jgi:hypothetical protein
MQTNTQGRKEGKKKIMDILKRVGKHWRQKCAKLFFFNHALQKIKHLR